jgi:1-acyl-sn-glycerol-3-phosphate acyltransferase
MIRAIYRILLIAISLLVVIPILNKTNGSKVAQVWAKWLASHIGITIEIIGIIPDTKPVLFVANHKSFIEGIAILSKVQTSFVGMAEIQTWPVIGYAAKRIETVFVKRDDTVSRGAAKSAICDKLNSGHSVLVFPEGKTQPGLNLARFFPGSFMSANASNVAVHPIAVWYSDDSVSWPDGETFAENFLRVFSKKGFTVYLHFGPDVADLTGSKSCENAKNWIQGCLDKQK